VGRFVALVCGAVTLALGVNLAASNPEALSWLWIDLGDDVRFALEMNTTILGLVVFIGAAAFQLLITVYSLRAMMRHPQEGRYYAFVIWSLAGACIVALADNLLVLLVGWEIVT
jgi:NADH:ubiquinone oxidoreductase subunit 5 (subunit L)/multisubunit Na+/H+ antiporter MnhA subunit